MHRLFVAIDLPPDIRENLVRLQNGVPGARWAGPDTLHLTLRFIGDVDGAQAEDIGNALSGVTAKWFDVSLEGAGVFPLRGPPRVLWAGVRSDVHLSELKRKVDSALFDAGCPREPRKFTPHITLARLTAAPKGRITEFLAHGSPRIAGDFAAAEFVLFESFLSSAGAIHQRVATYPLAAS